MVAVNYRFRLLLAALSIFLLWQSTKMWAKFSWDNSIELQEIKDEKEKADTESKVRPQKVSVTVYYEALCPDSKSFVVKQLIPTYNAIPDNIQIELIPYGKAKTFKKGDNYQFMCQHGRIECDANIVHACAIDVIKVPFVQLSYVSCMLKHNIQPLSTMKACAKTMQVDYEPILNCYRSSRGTELLAMYGEMTEALDPKMSFVPTITLDKKVDNQPAILKNLLQQVCQRIQVQPLACM
ncbi:GILT-like protein C02D5.2 isoform X2 [Orussus abietinus]|uniref:GILT-like protein C02D5.2 isoform X2 n=1 Tax=Orussus abietinus TaxID=222816 RepID=UPI000626446A|nr:GILT-like protein C02D5.2 isoform X2 [Orussus abietinus]